MLMILSVSTKMEDEHRDIVTKTMIRGFNDACALAGCRVTGGQTVFNPWPVLGGCASTTLVEHEIIRADGLVSGDVLVLTKPLGSQSLGSKMNLGRPPNHRSLQIPAKAEEAMMRLNLHASALLGRFGAHGATDVTGFGLLGHAQNLAQVQKQAVTLEIRKMPIIRGLLALESCAWIVGEVVPGDRTARLAEHCQVIEKPDPFRSGALLSRRSLPGNPPPRAVSTVLPAHVHPAISATPAATPAVTPAATPAAPPPVVPIATTVVGWPPSAGNAVLSQSPLQEQFKKHAGHDQALDQKELAEIWIKAAEVKVGKVSPEEAAFIEQSTQEREEFVAGMLGGNEDVGHMRQLRKHLNTKMKDDPKQLQKLISSFKEWDKNGDGYVSREELEEHLKELRKLAMEDGTISKDEKKQMDEVQKMINEMFSNADVDMDGKVEILLYDISKGMAAKLGPLLLGKSAEAVHTGVLVYGSEYWYGGKLFRSDPPCRKQFGEPLTNPWGIQLERSEQRPDLPVVRLGYTFVTHEEFVGWLQAEVKDGKTFLSGPIVALRPFLNRYLGGFADHQKELDENFMAKEGRTSMPVWWVEGGATAEDLKAEMLGSGDVVLVEGVDGIHGAVLATILKEEKGKCEIKYFDPTEHRIETMSGVPVSKMKRTCDQLHALDSPPGAGRGGYRGSSALHATSQHTQTGAPAALTEEFQRPLSGSAPNTPRYRRSEPITESAVMAAAAQAAAQAAPGMNIVVRPVSAAQVAMLSQPRQPSPTLRSEEKGPLACGPPTCTERGGLEELSGGIGRAA
eukprot:g1011.t1